MENPLVFESCKVNLWNKFLILLWWVTMRHLFFQCKFALSMWPVVQISWNLYPPRSAANLYSHWLDGIPNNLCTLSERLPGYSRFGYVENDMVFNGKTSSPCTLIYIYWFTHYLRTVYPTMNGVPTTVHNGVYVVGAGGWGGFYPTWVAA